MKALRYWSVRHAEGLSRLYGVFARVAPLFAPIVGRIGTARSVRLLLRIARDMRDKSEFASGRKLDVAPDLLLGATANPFVPPNADRVANLERQIESGAEFVQTRFCFDLPMLERFMRAARERGLHQRCKIIVGVGTLRSAKALHWMSRRVPGVDVPKVVIRCVAEATDQRAEGLNILVETIRAIRQIEGVAGVHLMGHRNEASLAEAILRSGIRDGPELHPA